MKFILLMSQFISIFALKLCSNCKYHTKGKCTLFPILDETQFLDWTRARKIHYFCGEEGRYYESYDKNIPDDYDFEKYIQLL